MRFWGQASEAAAAAAPTAGGSRDCRRDNPFQGTLVETLLGVREVDIE